LIVSAILKRTFEHWRPISILEQNGLLAQINLVPNAEFLSGGGSFPSGHTMGGFALYTLLALIAFRGIWAQIGLFLAAAAVGISRIYLVAHFPKDVLFGSFLGVSIAIWIAKFYFEKIQNFEFKYFTKKKN
jgi:membrane-associated phospholipid phosphatase